MSLSTTIENPTLTKPEAEAILLDAWEDAKDTPLADEVSAYIQSTLTRTRYTANEIIDLLERVAAAVVAKAEAGNEPVS